MAYHLSMDFSRPDNARRINRLKVLSELRKGTCSKAELSRRLDINKVSIGEICDKMIKEGLIEETGREQTAQGRPGTLLSINSKAGRVFSIEEGRKAFSVAVSDLQGRILRYERLPKGESFQDDIQKLIRKMSAGDAVIYGAAIASDYDTKINLPFPSVRISRAEAEAEAEVARLGDLESFLFISWSDTRFRIYLISGRRETGTAAAAARDALKPFPPGRLYYPGQGQTATGHYSGTESTTR